MKATAILMADGLESTYRWSLGAKLVSDITDILAQLPKEVAAILETMQTKITILENDKLLLQQENSILLRNQDMLAEAHRELYLENLNLKEKQTSTQQKHD